jgi:hypothetical protein
MVLNGLQLSVLKVILVEISKYTTVRNISPPELFYRISYCSYRTSTSMDKLYIFWKQTVEANFLWI